MSINSVTWKIEQMDCYPNVGDNNNVVFRVIWSCIVTENSTLVTTTLSGITYLSPPSENFTEFSDLTQDQVLDWVWNTEHFDKIGIETITLNQLENLCAPAILNPSIPWNN